MPEIAEYPTEFGRMMDILRDERRERSDLIKLNWNYYNGLQKLPLKVRTGQPDDNVIVNLISKMVDQAVSMLFGEVPEFQLDENDETPEEESLKMFWEDNDAPVFLSNLARVGAVAGHCFVKWHIVDGQPLRLVALDPEMVSVLWHPEDYSQIIAYVIYWNHGENEYRQDVINENTRWRIADFHRGRGGKWTQVNEVFWMFPWAPIYDWQNLPDTRDFYGMPDIKDLRLQDSMNFVASNTARIIKYHAHPKTIGIGFRANELSDTSIDSFWTIPNADARVVNLEMQSDLSSSMAFMQMLQQQFWSTHRGVDLGSVYDRLGQISNFGLRVLFADALDKLRTKQMLYGEALKVINQHTLELLGHGPDNITEIIWPEPVIMNERELVEAEQLKLDMGIQSKYTAASALGLDWQREQERMMEEQEGQDTLGARLLAAFERGQ